MLGFGSPSLDEIARQIRKIGLTEADDYIAFNPASISAEAIAEETEYGGVRVS